MDTFTHKPLQTNAIQFDGTIDKLVEIIGAAVDMDANTEVITHMVGGGAIDNASINGGGIYVAFRDEDWVLIPQDGRPPYTMTDPDFQREWGGA